MLRPENPDGGHTETNPHGKKSHAKRGLPRLLVLED